jgi:hypothetical protein
MPPFKLDRLRAMKEIHTGVKNKHDEITWKKKVKQKRRSSFEECTIEQVTTSVSTSVAAIDAHQMKRYRNQVNAYSSRTTGGTVTLPRSSCGGLV